MNKFKTSKIFGSSKLFGQARLFTFLMLALLSVATPAFAHHAMGGKMPSNFVGGFLSGLAHPLIGSDHFAFIIAVGLLAVTRQQGIFIPVAFILTAMLGTGLHLAKLNVSGVELFVSGSILLFGILLATKNNLNTATVVGLSAIAGIFHGYAYGESIVGAETTPLLAYLAGFTVVQLAVSLSVFWIAKAVIFNRSEHQPISNNLRSAGLVISGVGLAFFVSQVIGTIFPVS
jgi:urease accessory protein